MARLPSRRLVVGRGGQHPGQVVERRQFFGSSLIEASVIDDRFGLLAAAQIGVGPAAKRGGTLGIGLQQVIVGVHRLFRLLRRLVQRGDLQQQFRVVGITFRSRFKSASA